MGDLIRQARHFIYSLGKNVASATVERLLFERSWVPTLVCHYMSVSPRCAQLPHRIFLRRNSARLGLMLVVDLQIWTGTWKAIFTLSFANSLCYSTQRQPCHRIEPTVCCTIHLRMTPQISAYPYLWSLPFEKFPPMHQRWTKWFRRHATGMQTNLLVLRIYGFALHTETVVYQAPHLPLRRSIHWRLTPVCVVWRASHPTVRQMQTPGQRCACPGWSSLRLAMGSGFEFWHSSCSSIVHWMLAS